MVETTPVNTCTGTRQEIILVFMPVGGLNDVPVPEREQN